MSKLLKIEYHLVDHCNLNCICCEHFSSISDENFVDVDNLKRDFCRLAKVIGKENINIYLLGGEPLLHPKLSSIFCYIRNIFPDKESVNIRLVTNGLLLMKMSQDFWDNCSINNIILSVTKYPINLDYASIEEIAIKNNVVFEIFHVTTTAFMRLLPIELSGTCNPAYSFENCPIAHRCCYLKESKIYSCPRIPNIQAFNKHYGYNLRVSQNDYIELLEGVNRDDINRFLDTHNDFCKHCNTDKLNNFVVWRVHNYSQNEWI